MKQLPSKEELKKKHCLPTDDFEVRTQLPTKEERKERGGYLVKIGETLGAEEWMWKSIGGRVLAIIVLLPTVQGIWDYWQPKAVYAYDQMAIYFTTVDPQKDRDDTGFIAFSPRERSLESSMSGKIPEIWTTGTMIAPISGSKFT